MNPIPRLDTADLWLLAGWTMIHFLWLGTLVGVAAALSRLILRRASANLRYTVTLAWLLALAALPFATATFLVSRDPGAPGRSVPQSISITSPTRPAPTPSTAPGYAGVRASTTIANDQTSVEDLTPTEPRQSRGLSTSPLNQPTQVSNLATLTDLVAYLPWLWLIGTPATLALLLTGIVGSRRLGRASHQISEGTIAAILARLTTSLHITRQVTVAVCDRIAAPVLIGIIRPVILLPPAALTGWSPDEIEMVLLHELAHVRRWDNLINLLQRFIESLLFFHPAVWMISTWVRRDRESCCDTLVVGRTGRPHAYAEMLVALAAQMPRSVLFHPAASSAMAAGPLRYRIRRILQLEDDPMLVSGKSLALALGSLVLAVTLAVLYFPTHGHAEATTGEAEDKTKSTSVDSFSDATSTDEGQQPPAELRAKQQAQTINNLKNLAVALLNYNEAKRALPPQAVFDPAGKPLLSWRVLILPFLGEADLFKEFKLDEPWDSEHNRKLITRMPAVFKNPRIDDPGKTDYLAVVGPDCLFTGTAKLLKMAHITDGTANTIALVEADPSAAVEWTKPQDWEFDRNQPVHDLGHLWPGIFNAFTVDGAHHRVDLDKPADEIGILFTRNGRERESLSESRDRIGQPGPGMEGGLSAQPEGGFEGGESENRYSPFGNTSDKDREPNVDEATSPRPNDDDDPFAESPPEKSDGRIRSLAEIEEAFFAAHSDKKAAYRGYDDPKSRAELLAWANTLTLKNSRHLRVYPSSVLETDLLKRHFVQVPDHGLYVAGWSDDDHVAVMASTEVHQILAAQLQQAGRLAQEPSQYEGPIAFTSKKDGAPTIPEHLLPPLSKEWQGDEQTPVVTVEYDLPTKFEYMFPVISRIEESLARRKSHIRFSYELFDSGKQKKLRVTAPAAVQASIAKVIKHRAEIVASTAEHASSKFPTLEEQKLAHLAFSRLGVELEPIGPEDLKRVKALGYNGGLKVVDATNGPPLKDGDILVGLLAWPTTNFSELSEILNRDDIFELHPLKFYAVRSEATQTVDEHDASKVKMVDIVASGRIGIKELFPRPRRGNASGSGISSSPFVDAAGQTGLTPTTNSNGLQPRTPAMPTNAAAEYPNQAPVNQIQPKDPFAPQLTNNSPVPPATQNNPFANSQPATATSDRYAPRSSVASVPQGGETIGGMAPGKLVLNTDATDRTVVAYEVPVDLQRSVEKYAKEAGIEYLWDQKSRCIIQASDEQHKRFKNLLDSTTQWRKENLTPDALEKPFTKATENGDSVLKWRAAGLTLFCPPDSSPVVVKEVAPGSPAAWLDVQPGDALLRIERFYVRSLSEAESIFNTLTSGFNDDKNEIAIYFVRTPAKPPKQPFMWKSLPLKPLAEKRTAEAGMGMPMGPGGQFAPEPSSK